MTFSKIQTYSKDKRLPLDKIYNSYERLNKKLWDKEIIFIEADDKYLLPVLGFKTKKKGKALYIISGIHGEEPAGVNAIAKNIFFLNNLARKIPIVLIPLANPKGYRRNWRYPNQKRYSKNKTYQSVGDAEPFLIGRKKKNILNQARLINLFVINSAKTHPPILSLDFHEDDSKTGAYIFSSGKLGAKDPIARKIVKILKIKGFKFYNKSKTRFNELIINGIVERPKDSSIDELISSKKIIINNKKTKGPSAKSAIVIETNTPGIPLKKRVNTHSKILKLSKKFYRQSKLLK